MATTIVGGLGNQMFQYAAGLAVASRSDADLILDVSEFRIYRAWPYLLDRLMVPQDVAPVRERRGDRFRVVRHLRRAFASSAERGGGSYREPHFHVDDAFFDLRAPVSIKGYFQSPRYFAGIEPELHRRFQLRDAMGPRAAAWREEIRGQACPVSIHVRRGDYVHGAGVGVYATLGADYYHRAVERIRSHVAPTEPVFYIFSDDEDFARAFFDFLPDARVVSGDPALPHEDMHLMAECHHHVIANSTFSWWGAWLNSPQNPIVVAPSAWFSNGTASALDSRDLFPPSWVVI